MKKIRIEIITQDEYANLPEFAEISLDGYLIDRISQLRQAVIEASATSIIVHLSTLDFILGHFDWDDDFVDEAPEDIYDNIEFISLIVSPGDFVIEFYSRILFFTEAIDFGELV